MRMRGEMEVFGGGRILETRPDTGGMTTPRCFGFVTDIDIIPIITFGYFSIIQDSILLYCTRRKSKRANF